MNNLNIIQSSLDYIEDNLKTNITAEELSSIAGFSLFHYYRVFQSFVGLPVMQYILHRRLVNAIYEISCGNKMIDVAQMYGFETHAGFFKAFKREYDYSPSEYLKHHKVQKPYKIVLKQEGDIMISNKKISEMLVNWNLKDEKIGTFYYESSGVKSENTWYIGDDYLMKSGANLTRLKLHNDIAMAVQKAGLETTVPVPSLDGKDYVLEGDTYFCLTTNPKGNCIIAKNLFDEAGKTTALNMGEVLGQLHKILKKHDKYIICNDNNLFHTIKGWALPKVMHVMNLPNGFYHDYIDTFCELYKNLQTHAIHRNPTPSDFIMRDGKPVGFIQFELSERNIRIFDPCYAATAILSECFEENSNIKFFDWIDLYQNIIKGYDNVTKLSKTEKQALPYVIISIQMICVAYFSDTGKYAELAKINKNILELLVQNKEALMIN